MVNTELAGFGVQLRRLRQAAGLTQEELAARAGLTAKGIAALERGRRQQPYPHTVRALVAALELSKEDAAALQAAVARSADPPSTPAEVAPRTTLTHVPAALPGLIGREQDLGALRELMQQRAWLVTLTGPGGVGKTSLALHLVVELADRYPDGAVFVALAPLIDASLVIPTIAHGLGLREVAGQPLQDTVREYLRARRMLLVLDNVEHVLAAAPEIAALLPAAADVQVLATSRAPLRLRGEREYPVRPLELPALARVPNVEDVADNPAVELFVERGQAVNPAFALTRENVAAVAAICRRLDGLPLAVELAATRIRALSPTALLARLDRALPLLADGARDLPERQRTMQGTIGWSYDLLAPEHQEFFRALAVFAGDWTLEAAEAIAASTRLGGDDVLDALSQLVEQSLVIVVPATETATATRYRMLEPIRQYARLLLESSEQAEAVRRCHADYYMAFGRMAHPGLQGADQLIWLDRIAAEHDNLRAVLVYLIERREAAAAAELGFTIWLFWWMRGYFSEGRRWMDAILDPAVNAPPGARGWALLTAGVLAYGQGQYDSSALAVEESLRLFREVGDDVGETIALGQIGITAISRGDYDMGSAWVEEAVRRNVARGDVWTRTMLRVYSAAIPMSRGDYDRAARLAAEALTLTRDLGDRIGIYVSLYTLVAVARIQGDKAKAARLFGDALGLSVEMGDRGNAAYCFEGLAGIAAARDDLARTARFWGAAEALLETTEAAIYVHTPDRAAHEQAVTAARARLDPQTWDAACAAGRSLDLDDAVAEAVAFTSSLQQRAR